MTVTTIAVLVNVMLNDGMTVATIAVLVNVQLTEDGDYNSSASKCYVS
jgi:hypothetical protein